MLYLILSKAVFPREGVLGEPQVPLSAKVFFYKIAIVIIKMRIMYYINKTFSILSFQQKVKTPVTTENSVSILYFIQRINNMFSRRPEILQSQTVFLFQCLQVQLQLLLQFQEQLLKLPLLQMEEVLNQVLLN